MSQTEVLELVAGNNRWKKFNWLVELAGMDRVNFELGFSIISTHLSRWFLVFLSFVRYILYSVLLGCFF